MAVETRGVPIKDRGVRFALVMAAAVAFACINCALEFDVGQITRNLIIEDYLAVGASADAWPADEQRPLSNMSNAESNKGMAYSWPTKTMKEASCGQDELRVPTFIVPGSQKAGTSAIYELLSMHPHAVPSRKFEVHFFDYKLNGYRGRHPESVSDEDICERRRAYQKHFDVEKVQSMIAAGEENKIATFEKTPRYLCYTHIPGYVKRIAPWTKILITLRNPVDRAYSQWKMNASRMRDDPNFPSFEKFVAYNVEQLKDLGLSKAPTLKQFRRNEYNNEDFELPAGQTLMQRKLDLSDFNTTPREKRKILLEEIPRGFYAQQIVNWLDYFEYGKEMKIIQYEKLQEDKPGVFRDILNFIDVDAGAWEVDDEVFTLDYRPVELGEKAKQDLDNTTRAYLEHFYKPYNDELADLLGEEWRGIWDSS